MIFRAERGGFPVSWASHLALTDENGDTFRYAQRIEVGPQVDLPVAAPDGFDLAIVVRPDAAGNGRRPVDDVRACDGTTRSLRRRRGGSTAGRDFGLDLQLDATKPPALHDTDGWIDFGPAGGSYYYSRTAMAPAARSRSAGGAERSTGDGLVRPPVGRLHRGRRRRLGLVRGQPRSTAPT